MIRAARRHEIPLLPQIENAADQRYRRAGPDLVVDMPPHSLASLEAGRRRDLLWVATSPRNRVVGFVLMEIKGGTAWIEQLSVLDRWQGRGLGAALIDRSAAAARALGHQALHLTTYRGVPWNEPFYRRRGFVEMPRGDLLPSLRRVLLTEIGHGHPSWRRAIMRRGIQGACLQPG
jgi:GNAT superfamily N-acetyltransferase